MKRGSTTKTASCPEKFILSAENELLLKELRETPDLKNFERFKAAFDASKDQMGLILKEAMDANQYSLSSVLSAEFAGCEGTLCKSMTATRPFSMRLELLQQIRRNVVHMTHDEWLFGKDLPIECPEYLCICLDMVKKMPPAVYAKIYDEMKRCASNDIGSKPRETIARRLVQTMDDRNITPAQICWYEFSQMNTCLVNTIKSGIFTARLTTLAYIALIKLNVSLDYLIEDDWTYKDITVRGKRITPAQRSFLTAFLHLSLEDQDKFAGAVIRAGLHGK